MSSRPAVEGTIWGRLRVAFTGREQYVRMVMFACASVAVFAIFLIMIFIFKESLPAMRGAGLGNLFFSTKWSPKSGNYGMLGFIWGTIFTTVGAMIIGAPLAIGTAIFLDQVAPVRVAGFLRRGIELLASVPSVVIGWFGLTLLVPLIGRITGTAGFGVFAAVLVLVIMVLPTITTLSAETLKSLPVELTEASAAMGATRWQTIYKVLLPSAREGLLVATILGMGRAIGEAMAVQMVIGNSSAPTFSLFGKTSTLTTRIVTNMGEAPPGIERSSLFAMGLVLLLLAMFLIVTIRLISRERRRA